MRKLLGVTGLFAAFVLALTVSPVNAGSPAPTVASGTFTLVGHQIGLPNGVNRTEAFTVQQSVDGAVSGQVQLIPFSGAVFHGHVNCFTREGNQAIVGGTITMFQGNEVFVGTPFAFAIQDNPDLTTFISFGFDPFPPGTNVCDNYVASQGEPDLGSLLNDQGLLITTGNIMIHP
jgi:hypothetical protein